MPRSNVIRCNKLLLIRIHSLDCLMAAAVRTMVLRLVEVQEREAPRFHAMRPTGCVTVTTPSRVLTSNVPFHVGELCTRTTEVSNAEIE